MTSRMLQRRTTGHWGRLIVGWTLLVLGLAALVLPGPGLVLVAAGMTVLSQQYLWARKRLAPVRTRALQTAAAGVRSWPTIVLSVLAALVPLALGVVWGIRPRVPSWWPLAERWWLPGGWGTGSSLIISGLIALALISYSYWRFRVKEAGRPDSVRTPPTGRLPVSDRGSATRSVGSEESP